MYYTLDWDTKVISKNKDEIVLSVDYEKVCIHKGDEVCILQDGEPNENSHNKPDLFTTDFDFIYDNIEGEDDSGDYELGDELEMLVGIAVHTFKSCDD